jgi:hypothetical protein
MECRCGWSGSPDDAILLGVSHSVECVRPSPCGFCNASYFTALPTGPGVRGPGTVPWDVRRMLDLTPPCCWRTVQDERQGRRP